MVEPPKEDSFWALAAPASLLKEQLKDSLPGSDFFLLSRTTVCLGPGGKTFPLLLSPWQEIYSERMLIILFSTYFLYIILIPLLLIILPICFGSRGLQMGTNKGFYSPWAVPSDLTPK